MIKRPSLFLLQLGGPKDMATIEPFLANLFEDVLPLPRFLRGPLARLIAKRRVPKVSPLYREIGGGSPLLANTEAQAQALDARLRALGVEADLRICMRYAPPRAVDAVAAARQGNASCLIALPVYPQYSFATTRSSVRELEALLTPQERQALRVVPPYFAHPLYIQAVAEGIRQAVGALTPAQRDEAHLVFSAHGLPLKLIREGDPYPQHIEQSVAAVMGHLKHGWPHTLCYQSRVGPVKWLTPSTQDTLQQLGRGGKKTLVVVPIAFVSEHIETLHELDIELREEAVKSGVKTYVRVPTVSTHPVFIEALAQVVMACINAPESAAAVIAEAQNKHK